MEAHHFLTWRRSRWSESKHINSFFSDANIYQTYFQDLILLPSLALLCLGAMKAEQLSPAEISRLKYGCTCGSCDGGFLSPRMRETLLRSVEITYESINFDSNRDDDAERWCDANEDVFRYLSEYIRQSFRVNKGMIIGFFCKLWKRLASCLREKKLPTETNIPLLV